MRKVLANMVMRVFPQTTSMRSSLTNASASEPESDTITMRSTSTHYFFLDRKFSPFVNLRVGGFAMFNAKKVGTKEKYSLSKDKQSFSLLVSPSVGVKMHITPNIGIMVSISDEAYLLNAFDTNKNDYKNKLIHDLGISVGVCFQIKGW